MDVFTDHTNGVREVLDVAAYVGANPGADVATCGACGRAWDDSHVSGLTPAPSGRCPFEHDHADDTPLEVLECGHPATDRAGCGTGYARTDAGEDSPRVCYACADVLERLELARAGRDRAPFFAYLSGDGRTVTTWTGGKLARVTTRNTTGAGFGGERVYFRAVDVHGREWTGNSPGAGMYARLRRVGK